MNEQVDTSALASASAFLSAYAGDKFEPCAYFDKHLDCIRVQVQDCSVTEIRMNRFLTILQATHDPDNACVGMTVKGIRHLFQQLHLPIKGVMKVADLLDALVKAYPDQVVSQVDRLVRPKIQQLEVQFAEAA